MSSLPPRRPRPADAALVAIAVLVAAVLAAAVVLALLVAVGTVADGVLVGAGAVVAVLLLPAVVLLGRWAASASAELALSRAALETVATTSHEVLWSTDAAGRVTWTNDVVRDLLGYRPDELVGRPVASLVSGEHRPRWHRQMAAYVSAGNGWRDVPHRLTHRDGQLLLVEASGQPVVDRHGAVVGYHGTMRRLDAAQAEAERLADERQRVSSLLAPGAVRIAFQPIVNLSTGAVVGAEALSRFVAEPDVPPDTWFARAWEVGLGVALELQSLRAALAAVPLLPPDIYVSVNVAPRTVLDPGFLELLLDAGTPLERLVLEITEHESIDDYSLLRGVLVPARRRGLRLAVDDAGAGYASFRHIVKLRPDHIKLDRDLTAGIDTDPARRALASAVVVFALELDASVTAEGVETAEQLDTLRSLSVDAAQGFYLGRPGCDPAEWGTWRPRRLRVAGYESAG